MLPSSTFVRTFCAPMPRCWGSIPTGWWRSTAPTMSPATSSTCSRSRRDRAAWPPGGAPRGRPAPTGHGTRSPLWRSRPRPPDLPSILGLTGGDDNEGGDQSAQTEAERTTTEKPKKKRPATPTNVTLRVEPDGPTYICVDRARARAGLRGHDQRAADLQGRQAADQPRAYGGAAGAEQSGTSSRAPPRSATSSAPRAASRYRRKYVPASRERPRRDRRDGHRGAHQAGPRPQRPWLSDRLAGSASSSRTSRSAATARRTSRRSSAS